MLVVGICGSPKKERSSTRFLLQQALESAAEILPTEDSESDTTLLLDVSEYEIRPCTGCDACVRRDPCPESDEDDMRKIEEVLRKADGIIIAAPSYFTSVPGILKNLIDRSRPMKMQDQELKDKVFGAITYAGLRLGGQEPVIDLLNRYALTQGMIVVGAVGDPVTDGFFGGGSLQTDDGQWRSPKKDEMAIASSRRVGKRVAEIASSLKSE
ncbi:MAG: flavodoxin family protein [Candidatus Thorarchaeota archaeon]|nr:MAG: flavodoxin family protein [Candidatus Thorarchaeota archaeon]